jgi:hypothetical protein
MIQLLPGLRIKVSNKHSTYGRVKVKSIQLFLGKHNADGTTVVSGSTSQVSGNGSNPSTDSGQTGGGTNTGDNTGGGTTTGGGTDPGAGDGVDEG